MKIHSTIFTLSDTLHLVHRINIFLDMKLRLTLGTLY